MGSHVFRGTRACADGHRPCIAAQGLSPTMQGMSSSNLETHVYAGCISFLHRICASKIHARRVSTLSSLLCSMAASLIAPLEWAPSLSLSRRHTFPPQSSITELQASGLPETTAFALEAGSICGPRQLPVKQFRSPIFFPRHFPYSKNGSRDRPARLPHVALPHPLATLGDAK